VSVLRLSLEFHFLLNSLSICEWVLDSLKFHIVQYFLRNFSIVLCCDEFKFNQSIHFQQRKTDNQKKRQETNQIRMCQWENREFTGWRWMNWVECSLSSISRQCTPPSQIFISSCLLIGTSLEKLCKSPTKYTKTQFWFVILSLTSFNYFSRSFPMSHNLVCNCWYKLD
jgi:hypothetical protein